MHSLQMAEMEQEEELARVRRERDECEERLVEMSLELARAKSLEDEYYLVRRRRLTLTNDDDDGGGEAFSNAEKEKLKCDWDESNVDVDCPSTSRSSSKQENLRKSQTTTTATKALGHEHQRPSYTAQEAAALRLSNLALPKNNNNNDNEEEGGIPIDLRSSYLGMGFGWPQDHANVNVNSNAIDCDCDSDDGDGSQAVVSIEPYSPSTRRVSSSSLVSIPQEDEDKGATPTTQTESTTIDKMIIDGDERCTTSDTDNTVVKDKNKPGPQQQPSISSSLWNQVETFTKTAARRSKLSSAAESALFGRSGNHTTKDAHPHNKDSPAFGFGWPEKDNNNKDHNDDHQDQDEDGCLSVTAPTVPSTALSSSSITSAWDQGITTYNTDGSIAATAIRSSSNHSSSIGRMASNITTSSATSFVKSVVGDFLVNLKEETVRV